MDHASRIAKALVALSDSDSPDIWDNRDPHANDKNEGVNGGLPTLKPWIFDHPPPIAPHPLGSSEFHWAFYALGVQGSSF